MSECQIRDHIEIGRGDIVREVWSGIPGTVVDVDQDEAVIKYPSDRRLRSRIKCLVLVSVGLTSANNDPTRQD
ncbi:hypothetical protein BKG60_19320 [Mycobacterium syngnathidarum]|uniref:Uncharacterized protein n=3 Tax=Mycobacteriaceae TaxID=1762 RepID=A0ABR5FME9_9MYCO|nr:MULTISPECIES: hypothetical protein [Mycobacteriaceae]MBP2451874.1 hypothetical protein [Mycolicibacterium lutetiense]KLI09308.1 hypothetical protein AA982_04455 [Mycolicibacterium senegalense]KLO47700.1 hypothetical protein ABW05_31475 [Mycolicibacterium senegalense]OHT92491.1 hypothetical protein BKG61_24395 [Mycobacterium syngnathidarum]OLT94423.1 hypothetical protein BKG60_19320 [Mycobacterium syngnathidarum]